MYLGEVLYVVVVKLFHNHHTQDTSLLKHKERKQGKMQLRSMLQERMNVGCVHFGDGIKQREGLLCPLSTIFQKSGSLLF